MGKSKLFLAFLILVSSFIAACATKTEQDSLQLAGNRKMAIVLRSISQGDQLISDREIINYLLPLAKNAVEQTYMAQVGYLRLEGGRLLQSPDNLYTIAKNEIDDLLIVSFEVPEGFQIPRERTEEERALSRMTPDEERLVNESRRVSLTMDVVNGANLKTAAKIQTSTAVNDKDQFESDFLSGFRRASGQAWNNPNLYPRSDILYFANLLFNFSREKEKSAEQALTCDMAEEYLGLYEKTLVLFERAREIAQEDIVSQQEKMHELNIRIEESRSKANILEKCRLDADRQYELSIEFSGISEENHALIREAIQTAKLDELLQRYTDKPARLVVQTTVNSGIQMDLYIRYHPERYRQWIDQLEVPSVYRGYHVISLQPYHALMQTMVFMRTRLPSQSGARLREEFSRASMRLHLETLMNGSIAFGVNGRFMPQERSVDLFSPNSLLVSFANFEQDTIFTRSDEIFQNRGWISLSGCRTLEGGLTQDGLVLRFLGLDCQL